MTKADIGMRLFEVIKILDRAFKETNVHAKNAIIREAEDYLLKLNTEVTVEAGNELLEEVEEIMKRLGV